MRQTLKTVGSTYAVGDLHCGFEYQSTNNLNQIACWIQGSLTASGFGVLDIAMTFHTYIMLTTRRHVTYIREPLGCPDAARALLFLELTSTGADRLLQSQLAAAAALSRPWAARGLQVC